MKAIMCLGGLAILAGCQGSKLDLEEAQSNLASVTRERDDLKVRVTTLQQQLTVAKTDLAKERATETQTAAQAGAATMASKTTGTARSTPMKTKHAHKS